MKQLNLLFLLFCSIIMSAQEVVVLNQTSKEPVVGVAVYNSTKTKSTISDIDGKINLDVFQENERITFQHISHIKVVLRKSEITSILYLKSKPQDLDQIVISASKFEQTKKEVPQKIIAYKEEDVVFSNPQTSADLLQNTGQIFVQKSQLGGGSPMIRGFSTNRLLISVDDVRMNTAIFRGGNIQNIISIDPFAVQNTEVILGSGSIIYGSDAIGGVMNFYTKKPKLADEDNLNFSANSIIRYSSASNEKTGHIDFNLGYRKWAFLTSVSYTNFDDLQMGKNGPKDYLRTEYVITENSNDIVKKNSNPRVQKFTGYDQINFLEKIHYKHSEKISYDFGLHYSTTSSYARYDRLIRYTDDQLHSAEWDYGPQKWFMSNLKMTVLNSKSNLYDKLKITAAYQNFQESRIDRDFGSEFRRKREENVDVLTANIDFERTISERAKIFYGGEYIYNTVGSEGNEQNINTHTNNKIASRYPHGATWQSLASYINYKFKPNRKFTFQSGVRFNHIAIDASFEENNQFLNLPFKKANIKTGAFTATAGLSWSPNETLLWKLNTSTAFRAPNIDDVGKVFDSEPGSVVVPNANLKPEYAYGGELGLVLNFNNNVVLDLATYYTYLDNALVRRDFSVNGETQMMYDGVLSDIQAIQNASKAWIYGFEAGLKVNFNEFLKLTSQYSIVGGTEEDKNGVEVPVRHVAPAFGNTHLIWTKGKLKLDAFTDYNGKLSNNQLAASLVDYIFALDENGNPYSPSWYTLNFRSQYEINKTTSITAGIENITNQRYRPYASGIAAPGLNIIISLKYSI